MTTVRCLAVIALCSAGLLAKETTVVLPALLAVAAVRSPEAGVRRFAAAIAAGAVAAGFVIIRVLTSPAVLSHAQALPVDRRAWKDVVLRPFAALAVPFRTDAGVGIDVHVAALLLLVLIGVLLYGLSQPYRGASKPAPEPPVAFVTCVGLACIVLGALPLLTQFYVSPSLEGSRFLYLPAAGSALVMAAAVAGPRFGSAERVAAACTRDVLLADARRLVQDRACGTLAIADAPDTVRGVYIFREGLSDALAALPMTPNGPPCQARWTGGRLLLDLPGERGVR